MDKQIIEKIITSIINKNLETIKCSRTTLRKSDKEFIEEFEQNRDQFPKDYDVRKKLYKEHEKIQSSHNYTKKQIKNVEYWGNTGYLKINGKIYDTKRYRIRKENGLIDEKRLNDTIDSLQSAIDESPFVPFDTVTVRTGHWDSGHKTGDVIVQKGFASTSYTDTVDASGTSIEHSYDITYYICADTTKGLLLTPKQFPDCLPEEELLLGKGTRQYVLEQDDDAQTVSVLILPDLD